MEIHPMFLVILIIVELILLIGTLTDHNFKWWIDVHFMLILAPLYFVAHITHRISGGVIEVWDNLLKEI